MADAGCPGACGRCRPKRRRRWVWSPTAPPRASGAQPCASTTSACTIHDRTRLSTPPVRAEPPRPLEWLVADFHPDVVDQPVELARVRTLPMRPDDHIIVVIDRPDTDSLRRYGLPVNYKPYLVVSLLRVNLMPPVVVQPAAPVQVLLPLGAFKAEADTSVRLVLDLHQIGLARVPLLEQVPVGFRWTVLGLDPQGDADRVVIGVQILRVRSVGDAAFPVERVRITVMPFHEFDAGCDTVVPSLGVNHCRL